MQPLFNYIQNIMEGGVSGHMAHVADYGDFTLRDIKGLIRNLLSGKIEDITEKIDGMNIQATVNGDGQTVFIRNKGDLNSERGGMSIEDMASKWRSNSHTMKTFTESGKTISDVFSHIPLTFFNPDPSTRIIANCECVTVGRTNIIPYRTAQVDFHDLWVYKKQDDGTWEKDRVTKNGLDVIRKACETVDGAHITPNVLIDTQKTGEECVVRYIKELDAIFKKAKCSEYSTIDDWKWSRFLDLCPQWIEEDGDGQRILYFRWFHNDKSVNLREIKNIYKDHLSELDKMEKGGYKDLVRECNEPLDTFFINFGNTIIKLCKGIINSGFEKEVIRELKNDMEDAIKEIRTNGSPALNDRLMIQINRLKTADSEVNAAEGIVFMYKGRLMKITGSFAPLNNLLNIKYLEMNR